MRAHDGSLLDGDHLHPVGVLSDVVPVTCVATGVRRSDGEDLEREVIASHRRAEV